MPLANLVKRRLSPLSPLPTRLAKRGHCHPSIKAVLFDVYGTLLISASGGINQDGGNRIHSDQMTQLLDRYDIHVTPQKLKEDLMSAILAEHDQIKAKGIAYPEVVIESIWESLLGWRDTERIKQFVIEYEMIINPIWPMPHLWTVLKGLSERNITLGIISNAQFYTPLMIEASAGVSFEKLRFDPDLIFFSYQYGQAKPSAYLFEKAAHHLYLKGISAKNTLYLGNDMINDVIPAGKVGFQTALFAGDSRSLRLHKDDPDCHCKTADLVITDLIQLLEVIS
jgi:putative hydrolase of the HAD superfamily